MTSVAQNSDEHIQGDSKKRESSLVSCGLFGEQLQGSVFESLIVTQLKLVQDKITYSAGIQVNCCELSYPVQSLCLLAGSSMELTYTLLAGWFISRSCPNCCVLLQATS